MGFFQRQFKRSGRYFKIGLILYFSTLAQAQAHTSVMFAPDGSRGIVLVQTFVPGKGRDLDAQNLFESMAAPEQEQSGGVSKGIKTADQNLVIACSTRHNQDIYTCSIVVKTSEQSKISPTQKLVEFHAKDRSEASNLFSLFHPTGNDSFQYHSVDGQLSIDASPFDFNIKFVGP